jgi:hypothetical protein
LLLPRVELIVGAHLRGGGRVGAGLQMLQGDRRYGNTSRLLNQVEPGG